MRYFSPLCLVVFGLVVPQLANAFDHSHAEWSEFLKSYVVTDSSGSYVNYAEIQKSPSDLKKYLKKIEEVPNHEFNKFEKNDQLAFLINAYNAFTIKLVLDHYPISSIKDIKSDSPSPWDIRFFSLLGKRRTLNELEHEIIRKDYKEPRIHFALVCAAQGCPALKDEAYQGEKIDEQMDRSTKEFLSDTSRNRYDEKRNRLYLSEIFNWYKSDFTQDGETVQTFVSKYLPELSKSKRSSATIQYTDYSWSLNDANTIQRNPSQVSATLGSQEKYSSAETRSSRSENSASPGFSGGGGGLPPSDFRGSSAAEKPSFAAPAVKTASTGSSPGSGTERDSPPSRGGGSGGVPESSSSRQTNGTGSGSERKIGSGSEKTPPANFNATSASRTGSGTESSVPAPRSTGSGTERSVPRGSGTESSPRSPVGSASERPPPSSASGSGTESSRRAGSTTEIASTRRYSQSGSGSERAPTGSGSERRMPTGSESTIIGINSRRSEFERTSSGASNQGSAPSRAGDHADFRSSATRNASSSAKPAKNNSLSSETNLVTLPTSNQRSASSSSRELNLDAYVRNESSTRSSSGSSGSRVSSGEASSLGSTTENRRYSFTDNSSAYSERDLSLKLTARSETSVKSAPSGSGSELALLSSSTRDYNTHSETAQIRPSQDHSEKTYSPLRETSSINDWDQASRSRLNMSSLQTILKNRETLELVIRSKVEASQKNKDRKESISLIVRTQEVKNEKKLIALLEKTFKALYGKDWLKHCDLGQYEIEKRAPANAEIQQLDKIVLEDGSSVLLKTDTVEKR